MPADPRPAEAPVPAPVPAPASRPAPGGTSRRARQLVFVTVLLPVLALLAVARRPPVMDLPLLLEQAARCEEILRGERRDLVIDWLGPNKLGPALTVLARGAGGAAWAPRLAVMLAAVLWLAALHDVAARARRPAAAALLVTPLLFGSVFYAGFLSFLTGAAAIAFWVRELDEERRQRPFLPIALSTAAGAALLYLTHALWLVAGGFAVATCVLLHRFRLRETLARAAGATPFALLLVFWSGGLTAGGWQSSLHMMVEPAERIASLGMAASLVLGGLRHPVEKVVLLALLAWIIGGAARALRERGAGVHPFLLTVGLVLAALALLAPDTVDKTMFFAWRWGGFALACLVLAVPAPRVDGRLLLAFAAVVVASHLAATAGVWARYGRVAMAGFEPVLAAVPAGARLVALDLGAPDPELALSPFAHAHVWAAVERGATVPFTFADLGNSWVRWRDPEARRRAADYGHWSGASLRRGDLAGHSHLLARCPAGTECRPDPAGLRRVAGGGDWALFEIRGTAATE
jgi:hypothetical protein